MVPTEACGLETTGLATPTCGMREASVTAWQTPITTKGLMMFGGEYYIKAPVLCNLNHDRCEDIEEESLRGLHDNFIIVETIKKIQKEGRQS